jgi:hypothetical protein
MRDSSPHPGAKESAHGDFSHGLQELRQQDLTRLLETFESLASHTSSECDALSDCIVEIVQTG